MNVSKESMARYASEIKETLGYKLKATAFDSEIATGHATSSSWPNFIYFSDGADSNPPWVIKQGKQCIHDKTGLWPGTLVVGPEVYDILRHHPDTSEIRDWENYTKEVLKLIQTGIGDPPSLSPYRIQLIADLFGLKQIIVDDDFGKDMLLYHALVTGVPASGSGLLFKGVVS